MIQDHMGARRYFRLVLVTVCLAAVRFELFGADWTKVRSAAEDALVYIESTRERTDGVGAPQTSTGTGFIVSPDGYVITAAHVVLDELPDTRVTTKASIRSRKAPGYQMELIKKDAELDVAVLLLPDVGSWKYIGFGDSRGIPKDAHLYTLGFPGASDLASADGLLSSKSGPKGRWQTTLPINYGNSGGPVFEENGKVVAIAAGGNDAQQLVTFAVPEAHARSIWQIAVAELHSRGEALAFMVAAFVGGKEKIDKVNAVRQTSTIALMRPEAMMGSGVLTATSWRRYPDAERVDIIAGDTKFTQVVSPHGSFVTNMMGSGDVPEQLREARLAELRTDLFAVLKNIKSPTYTFEARGVAKVGDTNAYVVKINAAGTVVRWYVDATTGQLLRVAGRSDSADGVGVIDYSEWKSFEGLRYPTRSILTYDGKKAGEVQVQDLDINPSMGRGLFEKPAAASKKP